MATVGLRSNSEAVHLLTECNSSFEESTHSTKNSKSPKNVQAESLEVIESGKALKVQHTDRPHLVSLGGGRLSTAVTLFPLHEGRTYVGTEDAPTPQDVIIQGTGVEAHHCFIENLKGIVTIHPIAEQVSIDGLRINKETRLVQGSMICLGRSTYFRFNHPQEAQLMKSVLPNTRISVLPINFTPGLSMEPRTIMQSMSLTSPALNTTGKRNVPIYQREATKSETSLNRNLMDREENFKEKVFKFESLAQNSRCKSDVQPWSNTCYGMCSPVDPPPTSTCQMHSSSSFDQSKLEKKPLIQQNSATPIRPKPIVLTASASSRDLTLTTPKLVSITKLDPKISPKVFVPTNSSQGVDKLRLKQHTSPPNATSKQSSNFKSSLEELQECQQQHQKVVEERIREQELEKQEQMRLEEILNICAEYERQTQREKVMNENGTEEHDGNQIKHNEQISRNKESIATSTASPVPSPTQLSGGLHINRIKTNGSLPRDRAKSPNNELTTFQKKPIKSTSSEDELTRIFNSEASASVPLSPSDSSGSGGNRLINYSTYPQSPRTRIKTVVNKERAAGAIHHEVYENQALVRKVSGGGKSQGNNIGHLMHEFSSARIIANKAAIDVGDEVFLPDHRNRKQSSDFKMSTTLIQEEAALLRQQKNTVIRQIASIRHQSLDLDTQEEDVISELEMECALLEGELQMLMDKSRMDEENLSALKQRECDLLQESEFSREKEHTNIETVRLRLEEMEEFLKTLECNLDGQPEGTPERENLLAQIKNQHEIVETERKLFEDLEFQQLENDTHREEEREQIVHEWMSIEEQLQKRHIEIHEIEIQKEEVNNQIQQEKQLAAAERQRLYSLLKMERDTLATIDTKLKALIALDISTDQESDESAGSSDEGESGVGGKAPTLLPHERKSQLAPVTHRRKEVQKRGGFVFEEEIVSVGNTNSFSSFDSGTSSGTGSDIPSESVSSEEYAEKAMTELEMANLSDPQTAALWHKMRLKNAEELIDDTTPLCGAMQGGQVKHRDNYSYQQRPLTRYLPVRSADFNLKQHVESAGHQIELCPHIHLTRTACRGFLYKLGTKFRTWNKRWFVFDRTQHTLLYYADKNETRLRGCIYFQRILEVYVDHLHSVRSPNPKLTFCVKTLDRPYYLVAPSAEAMRMWVDVIFTGAEGYQEFQIHS